MDNLSEDGKHVNAPKTEQEFIKKSATKSYVETEVVELPSRGLLYSKESGLSEGKVEMRYMTAADEDILLSKSLVAQGIAIDKLLKSLIVSPINYDELLIGDKNALMFQARIMGYGKSYKYTSRCNNCDTKNSPTIDLTDLKFKDLDPSVYTDAKNEFEFTLPLSGKKVVFKLLTQKDSEMIESELKAAKRFQGKQEIIDPIVTTRLVYSIISIDGKTEKGYKLDFIKNRMRAGDSIELRRYMNKITPDMDYVINYTCSECGTENFVELTPDVEFFWPTT